MSTENSQDQRIQELEVLCQALDRKIQTLEEQQCLENESYQDVSLNEDLTGETDHPSAKHWFPRYGYYLFVFTVATLLSLLALIISNSFLVATLLFLGAILGLLGNRGE